MSGTEATETIEPPDLNDVKMSYDLLKEVVNSCRDVMKDSSHAGLPTIDPDIPVVLHKSCPLYDKLNYRSLETLGKSTEDAVNEYADNNLDPYLHASELIAEDGIFDFVNSWTIKNGTEVVTVWRSRATGKSTPVIRELSAWKRISMAVNTAHVATSTFKINEELAAVKLLRTMVSAHQFRSYMVAGMLVETSKQSGVSYIFRKLRPVIAVRDGDPGSDLNANKEPRFLAALCLHPLGYYVNTFTGCTAPTDDVIAQLLMMRGDERNFWAKSGQHSITAFEAGI